MSLLQDVCLRQADPADLPIEFHHRQSPCRQGKMSHGLGDKVIHFGRGVTSSKLRIRTILCYNSYIFQE